MMNSLYGQLVGYFEILISWLNITEVLEPWGLDCGVLD